MVDDKYSMRLNEIELRSDLRSMQPEYIFSKYGWKILGIGRDSVVAQHPEKSYVLKIFEKDSAYAEFVLFCKKNPGNPHLPRFYTGADAAKLPGPSNNITENRGELDPELLDLVLQLPGDKIAIRMEELTPCSEQLLLFKFRPELYVFLLEGINQQIHGLTFELRMLLRKKLLSLFQVTDDDDKNAWLEDFSSNRKNWQRLWSMLGRTPDSTWMRTVQKLMKTARSLGMVRLDMHEDNIMCRGETLVITDPFV